MGVIVRVNRLRLKPRNRIKLLDCRSTQTRESSEDRSLDLRHLGVLDGVHE